MAKKTYKKRTKIKKSGLGPIHYLLFLVILVFVTLNYYGITDLEKFKMFLRDNPQIGKHFGVEKKKVDHLKAAEKMGEKIQEKMKEKEAAKINARNSLEGYLKAFIVDDFDKAYDFLSSKDKAEMTKEDYVFMRKAELISWEDSEIQKEFDQALNAKRSFSVVKVSVEGDLATVDVKESVIDIKSHFPNQDEMGAFSTMSSVEVEKEMARIVIGKLRDEAFKVKFQTYRYFLDREERVWRVARYRGLQPVSY